MTAKGLHLQRTRRELPARRLREPLSKPARELWDEIRCAMHNLEAGTIALSAFDALIRERMRRTAELTIRCQISVVDAEHLNRLAAAAQRHALHQLAAVRVIHDNAIST